MMRRAPLESMAALGWRATRWVAPPRLRRTIKRLVGLAGPPVGRVDFGDFARARPISRHFGYDRGMPVDRWFIERFLRERAADIRGRALEIGDDTYCRRFGTAVTRQDVLHVTPGSPGATIVGDISQESTLPRETFDCLVITQTLHLIYDMPAAIQQMRRSLAPGGVLLLTVPGVSSVDAGEWGDTWYWALTGAALERLLGDAFGAANVSVEAFGNVYAATSFLQGLAVEDVDPSLLGKQDDSYPLVVCARACRAA